MKVLVTGFEPFGGQPVNASLEAVRRLPARAGGLRIATGVLPVAFARSRGALWDLIRAERPDCILCLGEAGGRRLPSFETVARNRDFARIPDNDGRQPDGRPIDPAGPARLPAALPLRGILGRLRGLGLPAELSRSAGSFLCNHVFYLLSARILREEPWRRGGFLHVPAVRGPEDPDLLARVVLEAVRAFEG